jgi:hypothetical protein
MGTNNPAASVEANTMYGVAVKIHEVVVETTGCFRKSLARSEYGWKTLAPRRIWRRAFTFLISPTMNGDTTSNTMVCTTTRMMACNIGLHRE